MTPAPSPPAPDRVASARRRRMLVLWICSGGFGLAMGVTFAVTMVFLGSGSLTGEGVPLVWVVVFLLTGLFSGVGFGLFMWHAMGGQAGFPPPGATMATRRAAARAVRRHRPTGDTPADGTARVAAENVLRRSPWLTLRLPLIVFLIGFGMNAWSILARFPWPEGILAVPWGNLLGFVLFTSMLTVALPLTARGRKDARLFLDALGEAERERPAPGTGR
ncbi:hypothetical protein [Nocardiopsis lambiniae]|uniref:Uncharacterized protein n=1 Tax=Nocardiopsis lambiniae TaxID=3075539 RepID=A0ABU2MB15_9ACTN|nr:hypothetical protein [Nocardiopsis sp. DSM 44743]MDT0329866.1 hypothetical protein [Nocardiopsis sp. DSM 44743]